MKSVIHLRNSWVALSFATVALGAWAQNADEHKDHHPAESKPAAAAVAPKPSAEAMVAEKMGAMDQQTKTMQSMHEKMMAAKTPEERMALMPENMKTMQNAMAMMQDMRANMGGMGMMGKMPMDMMAKHQMMEKRMDMMQSMMQMMMDQMQMPAAK